MQGVISSGTEYNKKALLIREALKLSYNVTPKMLNEGKQFYNNLYDEINFNKNAGCFWNKIYENRFQIDLSRIFFKEKGYHGSKDLSSYGNHKLTDVHGILNEKD